jgi:dienelactone hydrolase
MAAKLAAPLAAQLAVLLTVCLGLGLMPSTALAQPTQTLELELAGQRVALDVYHPTTADGRARGAVILSHGFTRSRRTMGGHAAALAARGMLALTPDLPYTFDFNRNAQGLAELVAALRSGRAGTGAAVERVVLVGFSAGALSSLLAANAPGVVGYVGLDAFDKLSDNQALGLAFAPRVTAEVLLLRAPPSRCNAESVSAPWRLAVPRLLSDRVIPSASHCDFESPSDWVCHLACGRADADRQAEVRHALVEAAERWLGAGANQVANQVANPGAAPGTAPASNPTVQPP